mmetsp:Transcript_21389/g.61908  ORF Transcript_21389/g.61908 Transcript_21389/m.61908 type:complete len:319 (+) Transcript_21389:82-1038(+)
MWPVTASLCLLVRAIDASNSSDRVVSQALRGQSLGNCDLSNWCATDTTGHSDWTCFPNCEKCDWTGGSNTDPCGGDASNDDVFGNGNQCTYSRDSITQQQWCNNFQGRLAEISCTPFPLRYRHHPTPSNTAYCRDPVVNRYTAWDGTRGNSGAQAWWSPGAADFWVLHGCDGAGTQMGDCGGGALYAEQFGPRCNWGAEDCAFRHPGTGTAYKWYNCGWWSTNSHYPDESKPWWFLTGLGVSNSPRTALLYPWMDAYKNTGQDLSWFWGAASTTSMLRISGSATTSRRTTTTGPPRPRPLPSRGARARTSSGTLRAAG